MAGTPVDDETLTELPPLDDEGDDDLVYGDEEPDLGSVVDDADPLDDADASLGDDGLEVEGAYADEGSFRDDASGFLDEGTGGAGLEGVFAEVTLSADMDEPGIGDEAFELDDRSVHDAGPDRGEEGPSEADEALRVEDLPELDADDDGDVAESSLYEPGLFVAVPRGLAFSWADRAWETMRVAEGAFGLVAGRRDSLVALSTVVPAGGHGQPAVARVVEVRFAHEGTGADTVSSRDVPAAKTPATSLALAWEDGSVVQGGPEAYVLPPATAAWVAAGPEGPIRVIGTSSGVYGLGRKGVLRKLVGDTFVPTSAARASKGPRALGAEESGLWVHALGASPEGELVTLVLDDTTGEIALDVGARAPLHLPALPDDFAPSAVTAQGSTVVVLVDDGDALVSWGGAPFVALEGTRQALGVAIHDPGNGAPPEVLSTFPDDERMVVLLHTREVGARVVAVLEPGDDAGEADDARAADADDGGHGEPSGRQPPTAGGGAIFVDVLSGRALVATTFGLFAVRPPQRV